MLLCQDILLEVLSHLAPGKRDLLGDDDAAAARGFECRCALVSCATVSKMMSQHALNVLWAELDSLDPILRFLPGYQRRRGSQSPVSRVITLRRASRFIGFTSSLSLVSHREQFADSYPPMTGQGSSRTRAVFGASPSRPIP